MARTHFKRYGRSAYRKANRLYKYAKANPQHAMALAKSAWSGLQVIRGLVNSEMFHSDQDCSLGSNQNAIFHITALAQGDNVNGRTGNSVLLKSLSMNGFAYVNASTTTNTRYMLALVKDTQQVSDTTPAIGDIFENPLSPHTFLKTGNLGRFKVLWRRQYTLDSNSAGNNARQHKQFFKLNFHCRYNGTSASDQQRNGVYLVMITSEPSNYPSITLSTRINYHDN